jgi:catechol 2,3-dioxygenase-like lactoylglutathione lyase family enzyme
LPDEPSCEKYAESHIATLGRDQEKNAMSDENYYQARREELKARYLAKGDGLPVRTGGVDHLALISSDLDATIRFYTELIGMRLTRIVQNRDEPTSTHIFLDMGGGNQLAFFDFPKHGADRTVRGVGSMHHIALKAESSQMKAIVSKLEEKHTEYSMHGSVDSGSVYVRDPDGILVEVTTGY